MATARRPRPGINRDTQFFWDGLAEGRLLIQRCAACRTLRHPPGPVCPHCHAFEWDTVTASGHGTIHSFVRMHHPKLPAFEHPNPIGLIDLAEGTRLVGGLVDFAPEAIVIGAPVRADIRRFDEELLLPVFRPAEEGEA